MTDFQSDPTIDDIVDDLDTERVRLERAGDSLIAGAEARSFASERGLRQAVRSDMSTGRSWAREQAVAARGRIEDEPLKSALYSLGIGVLIGILLRR